MNRLKLKSHTITALRCLTTLCVGGLSACNAWAEIKDGSVLKCQNWTINGEDVDVTFQKQKVKKEDFMVTLKNGNRFFDFEGFAVIQGTEEDFPPEQVFEALQNIGWSNYEKCQKLGIKRYTDFYAPQRKHSIEWFAKNYANYKAPDPLPVSPGKLRNLSETPTKPRFQLTGKVWPAKPGEASVCLWEDDKLTAFDFNQDDNNVADQPGFREVAKRYGVKATFNLITYNIDGVFNSGNGSTGGWGAGGKWDDWKKAKSEGFHIASHTYMHLEDWILKDGWPGLDFEAAESKHMLDSHLGQNTKVFVYPGGGTPEMDYLFRYKLPTEHSVNFLRPSAVKYYAAARGGSNGSPINQANMIDYFSIGTTQLPEMKLDLDKMLDPAPNNKFYRGWLNIFIHGLLLERWDSNPMWMGYRKVFDWVDKHRDDLWIGFMDDIALYGEERDTATLKTTSADSSKIVLNLTSQMEPAIFDYPLTIKVRLLDSWKDVKATQSGKPVPVQVITHEGAKFALVKAKPDCGEIVLNPSVN